MSYQERVGGLADLRELLLRDDKKARKANKSPASNRANQTPLAASKRNRSRRDRAVPLNHLNFIGLSVLLLKDYLGRLTPEGLRHVFGLNHIIAESLERRMEYDIHPKIAARYQAALDRIKMCEGEAKKRRIVLY